MPDALWNLWPVLVVGIMILAIRALLRLTGIRSRTPYRVRKKLVTGRELDFYRALRKATAGDWEVFAMVRMADLLSVPKGTRNYRAWLNRILSKHVDFVLCDRDTLEVIVGIELDDASHQRVDRMERDRFVNQAFADAGLPLIRIPVTKDYDSVRLRKTINKAIQ